MTWGSVADWLSAFGTIGASIVALWIALRADRTHVWVTVAEIGWNEQDVEGLRLDLFVSNTGARSLVVNAIYLRAAGRRSTLVSVTSREPIEFAQDGLYSVPWVKFEEAYRRLTAGRWLWRLRAWLPRSVEFECALASSERVSVPLPPRTLARIRGQKIRPEHWMQSHRQYP